jgi:hypothetical protein
MRKVNVIKLPKREYGIAIVQHKDTGKKASFYFDGSGITGFIDGRWFIDMFDERSDMFSKSENEIMKKIAKIYKW